MLVRFSLLVNGDSINCICGDTSICNSLLFSKMEKQRLHCLVFIIVENNLLLRKCLSRTLLRLRKSSKWVVWHRIQNYKYNNSNKLEHSFLFNNLHSDGII